MRNSMAIRRIASAALAASLALAVTVSGVGVKTAAASENVNATADIEVAGNVFNNGNFETGDKTSWINEQGDGAVFTVTDEEHFEGKYSLKLEKPSDVSAIIKNYCYYIEAGAVYTVSFAYWVTEGATLQPVPVVGQYTSDWGKTNLPKYIRSYTQKGVTDGWKQAEFDITVESGMEILELCLAAEGSAGVCYFDDVRVVKKSADGENVFKNGDFSGGSASGWTIGKSVTTPAETEKIELLSNGDFSNGFTGWSRTSNTEIIEEDGKNVLKMTVPENGNDSVTSANIPVEKGKTYTVSMRLKIDEVRDGNDAQCYLNIIDSKWEKIVGSCKTYGRWKEFTGEYTATTDSVKICLQHNYVAGTSYWSDISLFYEKVKTYTEEQDVTKNGGFENGADNWILSKSKAAVVSGEGVAYTGNNAVKYDSANAGEVYFWNNGTTVEAGKTYTMSYYVKTESDIEVNPYVQVDGSKYAVWSWGKLSGADEWTLVTNTFKPEASGVLIAGFQFKGTGVAYIDDMKITLIEEKEYQPTVSDGVGAGLGYNGDYGAMVKEKTEFWNYETSLEEGKTYTYFMYVKTEGTDSKFKFTPYLMGAGNKSYNFTAVSGDHDWMYITYKFTAPAAQNEGKCRFGFIRNGTGTVYISNLSVVADPDDTASDDMLPNGNFADGSTGWQLGGLSSYGSDTLTIDRGYTGKGALITHAAASKALVYGLTAEEPVNVVAGKTYTLKANVKTAGDVTVGASMLAGDNVLSSYGGYTMSGVGEWKTVTYHLTVPEDADVSNGVQLRLDMAFNDNAATVVYDDVVFYREYAYGDINGDDEINILDLIRIKKYFSDPDGTEIIKRFSDITGDKKITAKDMAKLRKMLLEQ